MPVLLRSVRLRMPPTLTLPHEGGGLWGASAPGEMPPSFETKTLANVTAISVRQHQLFVSPALHSRNRENPFRVAPTGLGRFD
jgi:hypothetical protein